MIFIVHIQRIRVLIWGIVYPCMFFLYFSGFAETDVPFGIRFDNAHWDHVMMKTPDMKKMIEQLKSLDDATRSQVFSVWVDHVVCGEWEKAFAECGWESRSQVLTIWNTETGNGGGMRWTAADQRVMLNFKNGWGEGLWRNFPAASKERQTVIVNPLKSHSYKYKNATVNPTQKLVWVMKMLIERHCDPEHWVFSLCAGSGTTVIACISALYNSISFELDPVQFKAICARINAFCSNPRSEHVHVFRRPELTWSGDDVKYLREAGVVVSPKPQSALKPASLPEVVPEELSALKCLKCEDECGVAESIACSECAAVVHKTPCGVEMGASSEGEPFVCPNCVAKSDEKVEEAGGEGAGADVGEEGKNADSE